ncbi:dephospho-CoA kinase [Acinetobacter sp. MD2(2019)]|uniref:dephospho-CoA kinase n=1 Tax=Acinetobacter sp. MD2(2019) TaxID=2605273 RepID=UPI002D1E5A8D|nr:dephospho-CoA kinase [Acinetobacter sp. MD2(2019)]MEB3754315.1 dephospho-CoA kinase [Acinetobacter sp. MD2(2019)]
MQPYIVGLTGGIGSGKTAASQWFEQQGIIVVDADIVARQMVQAGQPALAKIRATFGAWVLLDNGELNRAALREYIFSHADAKKQLEAITHPLIRAEIETQLQRANSPYVILVSPLLFETQQNRLTQRNLLIDTPEELQLQRASQRDQQAVSQIQSIIAAQMPRHQKQALADDIVLNDADLAHLYAQLQPLHTHYLQLARLKPLS